MTTATSQLLEEFDRLPPAEQREFSAVIVHQAAQLDYGDVTDEELTISASRIFAVLDEDLSTPDAVPYLNERAQRGKKVDIDAILAKIPAVEPAPHDRIPK